MKRYAAGNLAKAMLRPINPSTIILLGAFTVIWGIWVANPIWEIFNKAPLFHILSVLLPEWVWGVNAIICGSITIYGVVRPSYRTLLIGAGVMIWHWLMISMFYFLGDWEGTGGITAAFFGIYAAYVYLNLQVNKKALGLTDHQATVLMKHRHE